MVNRWAICPAGVTGTGALWAVKGTNSERQKGGGSEGVHAEARDRGAFFQMKRRAECDGFSAWDETLL